MESVGKGGHHQKVDPNEKYLSEKEAAELLLKNELDTMKTRGGHRDDETDDVQNGNFIKQNDPGDVIEARQNGNYC